MANIPFTKLEIPNGADSYVFDGITVDDLTELDLTQFPKQDQIIEFNENLKLADYVKRPELTKLDLSQFPDKTQINEFNENLKLEDYVKRAELTELDFDALIARLDNIVARIEAIEAKVGI